MGVNSQNKRPALVSTGNLLLSKARPITSIPLRPQAKTKPTISSALGGSRLRYWLCPSLLSAHSWGGLQSLYFGFSLFPSPCIVTTRASVSSHLLLPPNILELRHREVRILGILRSSEHIEEGRDSSLLALALLFDSVLLLQRMVNYPFLMPPALGAVGVARGARGWPLQPLQQKPTARRPIRGHMSSRAPMLGP